MESLFPLCAKPEDPLKDNGIRKDQIELILRGMWRVVNDPGGTGARAQIPGITVAGKTGTAQFWRDGDKDNHTWFIAFAPYESPKIAMAVLEGWRSGSGANRREDNRGDPGARPVKPDTVLKLTITGHHFEHSPFNPRNGEAFLTSSGENRKRNSQADAHSSGPKNNRRKSGFYRFVSIYLWKSSVRSTAALLSGVLAISKEKALSPVCTIRTNTI